MNSISLKQNDYFFYTPGFFTADYRNNWPPKHAVELISKLGCHVVPKASTNELVKLSLGELLNSIDALIIIIVVSFV